MTQTDARLTDRERTGMVGRLPLDHWRILCDACSEIRTVPARTVVSLTGTPIRQCLLLLDGLMLRHVRDSNDQRQMVALQVPGDFVDLHGLPLGRLDHDVATLTDVRLAAFEAETLQRCIADNPALTNELWSLTLVDAAIHRHWTFRVGRLRALQGMANFLCEIHLRLTLCDRAEGGSFVMPLTQPDLADACGLSPVHVNRILRELRDAGLVTFRDGRVTIHDPGRLAEIGHFNPDYLYLPWRRTEAD